MRLLTLLLLGAFGAYAQSTYSAASCSLAAVQSAYATEQASKADGDVISIPSCSATTWASGWTISPTNALTIQGQSTTAGTCAPGGSCTATDKTNITLSGSGSGSFTINTASGKSFRLTGLSLTLPSGGTPAYGAISINGNSTSVRVDHNHINDQVNGDHTFNTDAINGVFDHNLFDSTNQGNLFFIQPTNNGPDGEANVVWTQPEGLGGSNFVFLENNLIQNGAFAFDCDFGGRITFRYNIVGTNTRLQSHGVGSGAQRRGCRTMEVYQNTFTFSSSPNSNSFAFVQDFESGTGMWWGNTITGFTTFLREDVVRTNSSTYNQSATPGGWGYCGGGSNWDGNTAGSGYPCLDNIGRGAGELLSGSFPNLVNQSTGTIAWPNQALVPVYVWANTLQPNSYAPNHYWQNYDSVSAENRDYYLELPNVDEPSTFNGTAGIGQGLASAKPGTCTPSVGWWATDTKVFYQCSSKSTWTAYYAPYTYPHPLTAGTGTGTTVVPPTNLITSVH